jgi:DnaJ-class molecular chaperone
MYGNPEAAHYPTHSEVLRNKPIKVEVDVTLEDLNNGREIEIQVKRKRFCLPCKGIGASE